MIIWEDFRAKLGLDDNKRIYWRQIIHTILFAWKEIFLECGDNISDLVINEHQNASKDIKYIV